MNYSSGIVNSLKEVYMSNIVRRTPYGYNLGFEYKGIMPNGEEVVRTTEGEYLEDFYEELEEMTKANK